MSCFLDTDLTLSYFIGSRQVGLLQQDAIVKLFVNNMLIHANASTCCKTNCLKIKLYKKVIAIIPDSIKSSNFEIEQFFLQSAIVKYPKNK